MVREGFEINELVINEITVSVSVHCSLSGPELLIIEEVIEVESGHCLDTNSAQNVEHVCAGEEDKEDCKVASQGRIKEVSCDNRKDRIEDFRSHNLRVTSVCHVDDHNSEEAEHKAQLNKSVVDSKPSFMNIGVLQQEHIL